MKKATSRRRKTPTTASLGALPPVDFEQYEIRRNPYEAPRRPTPPDRSGMGILEKDK